MSKLVAVRIPDDLLAKIDEQGKRSAVILSALQEHFGQQKPESQPTTPAPPPAKPQPVQQPAHQTATTPAPLITTVRTPMPDPRCPLHRIPMFHNLDTDTWACRAPKCRYRITDKAARDSYESADLASL